MASVKANRRKRPPDSPSSNANRRSAQYHERTSRTGSLSSNASGMEEMPFRLATRRRSAHKFGRIRSKSGVSGNNIPRRRGYGPTSERESAGAGASSSPRMDLQRFDIIEGEGILSHLDSHIGYIWSVGNGSVYFQQKDLDRRLRQSEQMANLSDVFNLGDRVRFRAERQAEKNGCRWKGTWVSILEPWNEGSASGSGDSRAESESEEASQAEGSTPNQTPASPGVKKERRFSLPNGGFGNRPDPGGRATEVTVAVGAVTNAFKQGFGFVWSETLGRIYFTRDSYVKRFPTSCCFFGTEQPALRQSVRLEAVPQKEFSPSCSWRAVALKPLPEFVPVPSIRHAIATVSNVTRSWGSLLTDPHQLKIFFTLSDFHVRAPSLTDALRVDMQVDVGFVPQEENNGYLYRAVHVSPAPPDAKRAFESTLKKWRTEMLKGENKGKGRSNSPDEKSYSQVVKLGPGKESGAADLPDFSKPISLKLLHQLFPPWRMEPTVKREPAAGPRNIPVKEQNQSPASIPTKNIEARSLLGSSLPLSLPTGTFSLLEEPLVGNGIGNLSAGLSFSNHILTPLQINVDDESGTFENCAPELLEQTLGGDFLEEITGHMEGSGDFMRAARHPSGAEQLAATFNQARVEAQIDRNIIQENENMLGSLLNQQEESTTETPPSAEPSDPSPSTEEDEERELEAAQAWNSVEIAKLVAEPLTPLDPPKREPKQPVVVPHSPQRVAPAITPLLSPQQASLVRVQATPPEKTKPAPPTAAQKVVRQPPPVPNKIHRGSTFQVYPPPGMIGHAPSPPALLIPITHHPGYVECGPPRFMAAPVLGHMGPFAGPIITSYMPGPPPKPSSEKQAPSPKPNTTRPPPPVPISLMTMAQAPPQPLFASPRHEKRMAGNHEKRKATAPEKRAPEKGTPNTPERRAAPENGTKSAPEQKSIGTQTDSFKIVCGYCSKTSIFTNESP